MTALTAVAALATALAAGLLIHALVPPPRRLADRVGPYLAPSLSTVRRPQRGALAKVFGPIIADVAEWVGSALDRAGSGVTLVRLRQAGWFRGSEEESMVGAYRVRQLKAIATGLGAGLAVGHLLGSSLQVRSLLAVLGLVIGVTRTKGLLEKAIENRREVMKIEIYTINQLLAMRVRAGGGVIQAVKATVDRGQGEVVSELEEALRLHRAGWRGPDAFRRIAELTPEPFCARAYRMLASAEERGVDLGRALLSLSEDVRETRRESIKRTATKRRAAMLIPTIAILAPVLILFVAAPLPYLVTGWQ
ncbi:MAG TPA: type II secretion system F family protein [Acidimicrobiia bacterium]|nr:type II secretion system F family protein [Acidimicrobiia bacterium]